MHAPLEVSPRQPAESFFFFAFFPVSRTPQLLQSRDRSGRGDSDRAFRRTAPSAFEILRRCVFRHRALRFHDNYGLRNCMSRMLPHMAQDRPLNTSVGLVSCRKFNYLFLQLKIFFKRVRRTQFTVRIAVVGKGSRISLDRRGVDVASPTLFGGKHPPPHVTSINRWSFSCQPLSSSLSEANLRQNQQSVLRSLFQFPRLCASTRETPGRTTRSRTNLR